MKTKSFLLLINLTIISHSFLPEKLQAQNVGIGTVIPDYKLHITNTNPSILKLENSTALANGVSSELYFKTGTYYTGAIKATGMGTNVARLGLCTFASSLSSNLVERLSITDGGNVGIGNMDPVDAGLIVDKKVGAVNAMFGRFTTGIAIESNYPGIGLNSYYNGGRKTISTGYTGLISLDPVNGNLALYNSNASTATDAAAILSSRLFINKVGDIGIEGNTAPHVPLAFANNSGSKISLFGSTETANYGMGIQSGLMQLYTNIISADIAFGYGGSTAFTENMRIKGNGNVGIGEINPAAKLHIFYNSSTSSPHLRLLENDNTGPARIFFGNTAQVGVYWKITGTNSTSGIASDKMSIGHSSTSVGANGDVITLTGLANVGLSNTSPNAPLSFENATGNKVDLFYNSSTSRYGLGIQAGLLQVYSNGSSADIAFGYGSSTSFTERMRIKGTGNVGIGNTDAAFPLDITGRMRLRHVGGTSPGIWFNKPDNTQGTFIGQYDANNLGIWGPGISGSWKFLFDGNDGTVRIGTLQKATGYLVNVGGKIISEEVRVQLQASWPDYVFQNDYPLMPFAELENFIQQNNRLPGFAEAQKFENEGADIGETQRKLLEKVEELTLYILELNKTNLQQQAEIEKLKTQIESLH